MRRLSAPRIADMLGVLIVCVSGAVLMAWMMHWNFIVQFQGAWAPMKFNTALALLLCGYGLIQIDRKTTTLQTVIFFFIFAIGFLTLGEYFLGHSLGFDELLFKHYIVSESAFPGRMSPNAALSLSLCAIAFLLLSRERSFRGESFLLGLVSAFVFALGFVALVGYLFGIATAYGWGQYARMAAHTALCFIALGIGLGIRTRQRMDIKKFDDPMWWPILGFAGIAIIVLLFWQAMNVRESAYLQHMTDDIADAVKTQLETQINDQTRAIDRMAKRWDDRQGTPYAEWKKDAERYVHDCPAYQSLEWVDEHAQQRWSVGTDGRPARLSSTEDIVIRSPLFYGGHAHGFIVGHFNLPRLLRALFVNQSVFSLSLFDGQKRVYSDGALPTPWDSETLLHLGAAETVWHLHITPTPRHLKSLKTAIPEIILGVGLLISVLGSLLVYSHQRARRLAAQQLRANKELRAAQMAALNMMEDLERAKEAAESAAAAKAEFLANMSHEIRTPLNAVVGMTTLLLDTNLSETQKEFTDTIRSSGDALLTIINDILDFSKIEAGKLIFEEMDFDLRTTVESAVELLAERAQVKGIELVSFIAADVPVLLRGDAGRIRQTLLNLISNAVKFTEKGEVVVGVVQEQSADERVALRFTVRDTGIGISEDTITRLFQPFSQADGSTTRRFGGTGLGLAISKRLAEHMGGHIGVESIPQKGSTFFFTGFFERQKTVAPVANGEETPVLQNKRVLIVDDNETNRKILAHYTASLGLKSESVCSGPQALEVLKRDYAEGRSFDWMLLDMQMPGMNGLQLASLVHADSCFSAIRLIMLTSLGRWIASNVREEMGLSACLTKPAKLDVLKRTLLETLRMPLSSKDSPTTSIDPKASSAHRSGHILVAEDNVANQKVATLFLKKLGHMADVVSNGAEAVAAAKRVNYDLIFMDCLMPEMDGYQATAEIRRHVQGSKHIPIIAMTANALQGEREKCLAAGMDDYLTKPVDLDVLRSKLAHWLPPATVLSSPAPLVDTDRLQTISDGDQEGLRYLLGIFCTETAHDLKNLEEAIQKKNILEVLRLAHGVAGACATYGMVALARPLRTIEGNAKAGHLADVDTLFGESQRLFAETKVVLSAYQ